MTLGALAQPTETFRVSDLAVDGAEPHSFEFQLHNHRYCGFEFDLSYETIGSS